MEDSLRAVKLALEELPHLLSVGMASGEGKRSWPAFFSSLMQKELPFGSVLQSDHMQAYDSNGDMVWPVKVLAGTGLTTNLAHTCLGRWHSGIYALMLILPSRHFYFIFLFLFLLVNCFPVCRSGATTHVHLAKTHHIIRCAWP